VHHPTSHLPNLQKVALARDENDAFAISMRALGWAYHEDIQRNHAVVEIN